MIRYLACIALILFCTSIGAHAQKENSDTKIADWINMLGNDLFQERESAKAHLIQMAAIALPELRTAAASHPDREIKNAAATLVKRILQHSIRMERVLGYHEGKDIRLWVPRAVITSDGKHVITGSLTSIRVWDFKTGKQLRRFGIGTETWCLGLSPDETQLASGGSSAVKIWDWKQGQPLREIPAHTDAAWGTCFMPDGKRIASAGKDSKLVISDIATATELKSFDLSGRGRAMKFIKGTATGFITLYTEEAEPGTVEFWDVENGKRLQVFQGDQGTPTSMELSADHKLLLTASFDKIIRLWDFKTGKVIRKLEGHTHPIEDAVFAPGDLYILSCGNSGDPTIRLWETKTGKQLWRSSALPAGPMSLTFTPDGKHFVVTSKDGSVKIWSFPLGADLSAFRPKDTKKK